MINEGDRAPAIDVQASDGSSINLSRPGQPLVLYFYPKDDTSGCTREAQDFTALAGDYSKAGVKVVGVSRDPMKKHEKFISKYELAVPLASDEDGHFRRVRDLGRKVDVRAQVYGHGAFDLPDRCRRQGHSLMAQGESAGPRRRGAESGTLV